MKTHMKSLFIFWIIFISYSHADEYKKVPALHSHIVNFVDDRNILYAFVPGLAEDLFQTLKMKKSRGPAWRDDATSFLDYKLGLDHQSSYWFESTSLSDDCPFINDDYNESRSYPAFKWHAIKNKTGNQKTLFYAVEYFTEVKFKGQSCLVGGDEYFLITAKKGKDREKELIYLGAFVESLPREISPRSSNISPTAN